VPVLTSSRAAGVQVRARAPCRDGQARWCVGHLRGWPGKMVRWSQGIALHFGHFYVAAEMARQDGALVTGYCSADWSLLRKQDGVLVTE